MIIVKAGTVPEETWWIYQEICCTECGCVYKLEICDRDRICVDKSEKGRFTSTTCPVCKRVLITYEII